MALAKSIRLDNIKDMSVIKQLIQPRQRDLGSFSVRRILPFHSCRSVGHFVFFDHMGPVEQAQMVVRAHPHIGLATVTYLFEGVITHRDSLGTRQDIHPGDVNWMIAGSGISHSERSAHEGQLHGLQIWVALPKALEEMEPAFYHHPGATLPDLDGEGWKGRLILGQAFGNRSPVQVQSEMFYFEAQMQPGSTLSFQPDRNHELGVYVVEGEVELENQNVSAGSMAVCNTGQSLAVRTLGTSRVVVLGGEPLAEPRQMFWNFVSSRSERIEQAKLDWANGKIALPPDEVEFIPLPHN